MLENYYKDPATIGRIEQSLFGPYLSSFLEQATQLGYVPGTVKSQLYLLSVLSAWLERHDKSITDLGVFQFRPDFVDRLHVILARVYRANRVTVCT